MNIDFLRRLALFVVLLLAQALVLNHIHLFGIATPLLYVYFVTSFPHGYPRWGVMLWSFFLGLMIDIFTNTPGVASASMTLLALVQPYVLEVFMTRDSRDSDEAFQPALFSMGASKFIYYTLLLTFIYCLVFFTVETFSFFNWLQWLLCILSSTVLSEILVVTADNLRKH